MDYVQRSTFGKVFVILEHRDGGLNEWGRTVYQKVFHFDSYRNTNMSHSFQECHIHP